MAIEKKRVIEKAREALNNYDNKYNISEKIEKTKQGITEKADEIAKDVKQKLVALFFFAIAGVSIWVLFNLLYFFYGFNVFDWFKTIPFVYPIFQHIFSQIDSQTRLGIMYTFISASIFLTPIPLEIFYIQFLTQGLPFMVLFPSTLAGVVIGQNINYLTGRFFGGLMKSYIKKKTRKELRAKLKKYGIYAIAIFHVIPLPYPLFNFIVGLTRYNYLKWLAIIVPALIINYLVVYLVYANLF